MTEQVTFREASFEKVFRLFGHCLLEGGGANACMNGLGHLYKSPASAYDMTALAFCCCFSINA